MTLSSRQKVLIPLLIIVILVLAWEIIKSFQDVTANTSNSATPAAVIPSQSQTLAPKAALSSATVPVSSSASAPTSTAVMTDNEKPVKLSDDQKQYIQLVSQYQTMQMQKMLAESKSAILEAKVRAAQAQAKLDDIHASDEQANPDVVTTNTNAPDQAQFQLVYTGQLQGQWNATLRKGKELIDVTVGNQIEEGTVVSINNDRVILKTGSTQRAITFNGEVAMPANTQPQVASNTSPPVKTDTSLARAKDSNLSNVIHGNLAAKQLVDVPKKANQSTGVVQLADSNSSALTGIPKFKSDAPSGGAATSQLHKKKDLHPAVAKGKYTENEHIILNKDPKKFTIQIIGSHDRRNIVNFARANNLDGKILQFQTKYLDRPWYVLIFGEYNTVSKALNTIHGFPEKMRVHRPFVSRIHVIQNEITYQKIVMHRQG